MCQREGYTYEMIFVDDGSDDGSFAEIKTIAARDAKVRAIRFQRNFGQTAAMSAGIHESRYDVIVTLDADLQNDPDDVPMLLQKLDEGFDIVSGWRRDRHDSWAKRFVSRRANSLISWLTGVHLNDYGCSLKAYRREYVQLIPLYGEMHRFIPVFAAWYGARVTEMPVRHHLRAHGKSHYGICGRTLRVLLDLITVKFLHSYITRPMHFFGAIGVILMSIGMVSGTASIVLKIMKLRDFVDTPLPLLGVFLVTVGMLSLLLGLQAELLIRIYFEQPGRKSYSVKETIGIGTPG